jgi:hypothetical protein
MDDLLYSWQIYARDLDPFIADHTSNDTPVRVFPNWWFRVQNNKAVNTSYVNDDPLVLLLFRV